MRPTALRRLLPLALVAACAPHAWADDPVPAPAAPPGALVDPTWSGPPPGPEPAALPEPPPPASGTSFPASAPLAPPSTGFASASILSVTKNHNIPLSDGTLALRLDTRYRVDDTTAHAYRVWITFFDRASGLAIHATKPTFADATGGLHVMTKPAHSTAAGQEFEAPLFIPYVVFPDPGVGQSTEIEARVELTRVEGGSQEVPVANSSTTFRVHGAPLDPAAAPAGAPVEAPPVTEFPAPK